MRIAPYVLSIVPTLVASALAQGTPWVSPSYYTAFDGNAASTWPFSADNSGSYSNGIRLQQVHGDARGRAMTIGSLALRANAAMGKLAGDARTLDVELRIGDSDLANMSTDFAGNFVLGGTMAMTRRLVAVPQRTGVSVDFVGPWDFVLPFDQPFVFGGQHDLAWDFANYTAGSTRRNGSMNDLAVPTNGLVGSVGAGIAVRGSISCSPYELTPSAHLTDQNGGEILLSLGARGGPGQFVAIGIGATDPSIPYPWGSCNNLIRTDALIILGGNYDASGNFGVLTTLPWSPAWASMRVTTQGFTFWPGLTQAVLTAGYTLELPPGLPPVPAARILYADGQAPPAGIIQNPGVQLVVRFDS